MRIPILLLFLFGCSNLNAGDLQLEEPYVLPKYPELMARAGVGSTFELYAEVLEGKVTEIKVQSSNFTSPMTQTFTQPEDSQAYLEFKKAIEDALKTWRFGNKQSGNFHLTVIFHIVGSGSAEDPKTTIYKVEKTETFGFPKRITIENHMPSIMN